MNAILGLRLLRGLASWWHLLYFGAMILVVVLSPSSYNQANRATTFRHIYTSTWKVLPWYTSVTAFLSLVLIRIVVVTAMDYGLSQYALEMVVHLLILELIPLSAALYVALRTELQFRSTPQDLYAGWNISHMRRDFVPSVVGNTFSVIALTTASCVMALLLAYIALYGFSPWALPNYIRTVGSIFDPAASIGFILKTILFSLTVAVVPVAAKVENMNQSARLFLLLLLVEAASLAIKYI